MLLQLFCYWLLLLISFCVTTMLGLLVEIEVLLTFLPGLALNCHPPNLCLLSNCDY
jgi:hypothetical protein